jgi:hypothetical protein
MFTIRPSWRLAISGITILAMRRVEKVLTSKSALTFSNELSMRAPGDEGTKKAVLEIVLTRKRTGTYGASIIDHDIDFPLLAENLLNDILNALVAGHIQNHLSDIWIVEISHFFKFASRCVDYTSFVREFLRPEIMFGELKALR